MEVDKLLLLFVASKNISMAYICANKSLTPPSHIPARPDAWKTWTEGVKDKPRYLLATLYRLSTWIERILTWLCARKSAWKFHLINNNKTIVQTVVKLL